MIVKWMLQSLKKKFKKWLHFDLYNSSDIWNKPVWDVVFSHNSL